MIQSYSKGLRTRGPLGKSLSWKAGEPEALMSMGRRRWISQLKERIRPSFAFFAPFRPQWIGWCPHWWRQIDFFGLFNQRLISSRNTHTDKSRNNILPVIWAFLRPIKLTDKINHHIPYSYPLSILFPIGFIISFLLILNCLLCISQFIFSILISDIPFSCIHF